MGQGKNLLNRLSNVFSKDVTSNLGDLMNAIGERLDNVDPKQTQLVNQFSMSAATGSALDAHGKDWGVPRRNGEIDSDYRSRIQAVLPIYTSGPTVSAISHIVSNFVGGIPPIILEYGPMGFTMGVSPMSQFVFSLENPFTFQVQVQNPNNVSYKIADMEHAVNMAKPARSLATFVHQGGV